VDVDSGKRILLIDPADAPREILGRRLRAQGYLVDETGDPAAGAHMALSAPPAAVIADLWMPGISGVQLCRLLGSEPATADVPVVLCAEHDEPRSRFWADRAGAAACVLKGRTGDLVRALAKAVAKSPRDDGFFVQLAGGSIDIRDRLARHLDKALFDSVIAAELRSLASAASFERLFDLLAQLLSQITRYRWIALATGTPERLAVHHHPRLHGLAESEARAALHSNASSQVVLVEDEDAADDEGGQEPIVRTVLFAGVGVARFALCPCADGADDVALLVSVVARELGGAIKIATLVEDSQRLAATDALTGLMNRRAFSSAMAGELARCERHSYPLALALMDIDHFKQVNDQHGHAAGDRVLNAVGKVFGSHLRASDLSARWGGEEFVVAFTSTGLDGARTCGERLRAAIEGASIANDAGERIPVTASIGVAVWVLGETLDSLVSRADLAMYSAKSSGRNRVAIHEDAPARHLAVNVA
jgi:two-component system cell cycle response regulator